MPDPNIAPDVGGGKGVGPDMAAFGRRIKEARKARGMSLDALSAVSGLSKPHIWELERGSSKNPTVRAVWALARGLAVTPAYLLNLETDVSPISPLALEVAALIERRLSSNTEPTLPEGFVAHSGGPCPVADCDIVTIKLRNGLTGTKLADTLFWHHDGRGDDIIAYKVETSNAD